MKKPIAALAASVALVASVAVVAPAQAYDEDAYAYAATHMLKSDDLPAALGDFGNNMFFSASQSTSKIYLCYIGQTDHTAPGGRLAFGSTFNESLKDASANSLGQTITQYASAEKAISAFAKLQKAIKKCTGTTTQTWANDDGSTQTSSSLTTNGKVPGVTEVGVESVFVNQNYLSTSSDGKDKYSSDSYTVFTLLNDVILSTNYSSGTLENIPTKLRKKVNQVAFTAIDRWLD